jgi:hypothetical protein
MLRIIVLCASLIFVTADTSFADQKADTSDKLVSGMSIVGNDEAPKALVIGPWKSSELGDALDVSRLAGDDRSPVDRYVFMRELEYYRIRSGTGTGSE